MQILAVNGISLLNMSYEESLKLLKNTANVVDLTVSQIFAEYQRKMQHPRQQQQQQHQPHQHMLYENTPIRKCIQSTNGHGSRKMVGKFHQIAQYASNSLSPYANEPNLSYNDNENSCLGHVDYDNNNQDITVLVNEQLNKNVCDAPNVASYSNSTDKKSFTEHSFNEIPNSSDALTLREFSDNSIVSANRIPDLPKVN